MPRKTSSIAPDWWDYTTLDDGIIHDAATLTPEKMQKLSRPGFKVLMYDTLEIFISPRRSNTSPPGNNPPPTIPSASAVRLGRRSSCRWSRG